MKTKLSAKVSLDEDRGISKESLKASAMHPISIPAVKADFKDHGLMIAAPENAKAPTRITK